MCHVRTLTEAKVLCWKLLLIPCVLTACLPSGLPTWICPFVMTFWTFVFSVGFLLFLDFALVLEFDLLCFCPKTFCNKQPFSLTLSALESIPFPFVNWVQSRTVDSQIRARSPILTSSTPRFLERRHLHDRSRQVYAWRDRYIL